MTVLCEMERNGSEGGWTCVPGGRGIRLSFFSLLYGTPAPSSERQHLEAWPASTYGHLREGYLSVPCKLMYRPILSTLADEKG